MIKAINSKAFESIRDGVMDGVDSAWRQTKRVKVKSKYPYVALKSESKTGSWIGLGLVSIAALAVGAWLYFRKRKQVSDHYTMGEGPGATESWAADQTPVNEQMMNSNH